MASKIVFKCRQPGPDGRVMTQTYEGFWKPFYKSLKTPKVLAFARSKEFGVLDVWAVDPKNEELAVEEIKRMYRSEDGIEVEIVIYRREG